MNVVNLFHGNPFQTPVGQLIEQATDATANEENWGLYMQICDLICDYDEGPKDAVRAFKKRISSATGKSNAILLHTLTVTEACVKNCGHRMHLQIATKDFLHELLKILSPKNEASQIVQDKVLSLIQAWTDAFRDKPDLKEVEKVYEELSSKGVQFPMTDLDSMAPIHTPHRRASHKASLPTRAVVPSAAEHSSNAINRQSSITNKQEPFSPARTSTPVHHLSHNVSPPIQPPVAAMHAQLLGPVVPTPEQLAKLRSELDVVQGNVRVFNDMLNELTPDSISQEDLQLLQELNRTCRQMQQRIVELVTQIANDEVTGELLRVNDDLNNAFLRYDRFERYRVGGTAVSANTSSSLRSAPHRAAAVIENEAAASTAAHRQLIDFESSVPPLGAAAAVGHANSLSSQLATFQISKSKAAVSLQEPPEDSDFDMFAASRQSFASSRAVPSAIAYAAGAEPVAGAGGVTLGLASAQRARLVEGTPDTAADLEDMEQWLSMHDTDTNSLNTTPILAARPLTSSEFDRFLEQQQQQASEASTLPRRTLKTDNKDKEDVLFAL